MPAPLESCPARTHLARPPSAITLPLTPHTTVLTLSSPYLLTLASYYRHPNHRHTISSTITTNSTSPAATHSPIIACTYPPEKGPRPPLKRLTPQAFHPDASDPTIFVSATSGLIIDQQHSDGCHCDADHSATHSRRAVTFPASTSTSPLWRSEPLLTRTDPSTHSGARRFGQGKIAALLCWSQVGYHLTPFFFVRAAGRPRTKVRNFTTVTTTACVGLSPSKRNRSSQVLTAFLL